MSFCDAEVNTHSKLKRTMFAVLRHGLPGVRTMGVMHDATIASKFRQRTFLATFSTTESTTSYGRSGKVVVEQQHLRCLSLLPCLDNGLTYQITAPVFWSVSCQHHLSTMPAVTADEGSTITQGFSILSLIASFIKNAAANSEDDLGIWFISTLKRRRKMMNKHKLRKRRKKNRMKSKK